MNRVYFIGGSPCSGKSTVAEILAKKYDLYYFKVDDFLDKYIDRGACDGRPVCSQIKSMTPEETWMRAPMVQCEEELAWYREVFDYVCEEINRLENTNNVRGIIAEGAAYLPDLMKSINVPYNRYLAITPTKDFQVFHYSQREWVPYVLQECSDKDKAFENWMERDALFAKDVQRQCGEEGYLSIVNNGERGIEELVKMVEGQFKRTDLVGEPYII